MRKRCNPFQIVSGTPQGVCALAAIACIGFVVFLKPAISEEATPLESVQIMSGNYRKGGGEGVIGHLGGVPVSIPKEFAYFVEYDGDPGFLEKRKGPIPTRTFESGIRGFGFEIRYPDMMPVNEQTWKEKRSKNIYNTTWFRVGINSNSRYRDRSPTRFAKLAGNWLKYESDLYQYEEQSEKVHGLTAYIPINADMALREMGVNLDRNIYIHYIKNNDVDAYIDCSNRNHEAAPCKHRFGLGPDFKVSVDLSYRKGLLPHWQEIQDGITRVLLGFRVDPSKPPMTQAPSSSTASFKTSE